MNICNETHTIFQRLLRTMTKVIMGFRELRLKRHLHLKQLQLSRNEIFQLTIRYIKLRSSIVENQKERVNKGTFAQTWLREG